jgi:hypothetical protein
MFSSKLTDVCNPAFLNAATRFCTSVRLKLVTNAVEPSSHSATVGNQDCSLMIFFAAVIPS